MMNTTRTALVMTLINATRMEATFKCTKSSRLIKGPGYFGLQLEMSDAV